MRYRAFLEEKSREWQRCWKDKATRLTFKDKDSANFVCIKLQLQYHLEVWVMGDFSSFSSFSFTNICFLLRVNWNMRHFANTVTW